MDYKRRYYDLERAIQMMIYASEEGSANINFAISEARASLIDSIISYPNSDIFFELFDSRKNDNGAEDRYISGARYYIENEINGVEQQINEETRKESVIESEKKQAASQSSDTSSDLTISSSSTGGKLVKNTSEMIKNIFETIRNI